MQRLFSVGLTLLAIVVLGLAQEKTPHIALTAGEVKWGPAPPSLPKGAQIAVVSGDPSKSGPFAIRLKFPAGFRVPPHWHPTDEHVTVLSGTIAFGMGEKFDKTAMKVMTAGGYAMMPAEMRHFALAKTAVTLQVHGVGPFVLNYVNPADDPAKVNTSK